VAWQFSMPRAWPLDFLAILYHEGHVT